MTLQIYTDGACEPNPGIGGWGWHSSDGKEAYGGRSNTTNNRMEMTAILEALKQLPDDTMVTVYSDSQYCVKGLTEWREGWRKKNWYKKHEPMPNRDLWLHLESQLVRVKASIKWVRGHNGDPGNEKADMLAALGRTEYLKNNPEAKAIKIETKADDKPRKPTLKMRMSVLEAENVELRQFIIDQQERIERLEAETFA